MNSSLPPHTQSYQRSSQVVQEVILMSEEFRCGVSGARGASSLQHTHGSGLHTDFQKAGGFELYITVKSCLRLDLKSQGHRPLLASSDHAFPGHLNCVYTPGQSAHLCLPAPMHTTVVLVRDASPHRRTTAFVVVQPIMIPGSMGGIKLALIDVDLSD